MLKNLVYALVDPRSKQWRYIGKSSQGLRRPRAHYARARNEHNHKASWIQGLKAADLRYEIEVLETFDSKEPLDGAEIEWIARAREAGVPLTNGTDGGDGHVGQVRSPEVRAKIAAGLRGKRKSPEAVANWMAARTYFKHSVETRAKIGDIQRGRKQSAEWIAKRSIALTGRKMSTEAIARSAAARRGLKRTPEQRERIGAGQLGRKQSAETVAKRVASIKAARDRKTATNGC